MSKQAKELVDENNAHDDGQETVGGQSSAISFQFFRGSTNWFEREQPSGHAMAVAKVRGSLTEVLNSPNIAFLLGAGCSSHMAVQENEKKEKYEAGIPTMAALAMDYLAGTPRPPEALTASEIVALEAVGIDLGNERYRRNLEPLMEVLFAWRFVLLAGGDKKKLEVTDNIIKKIQSYILRRCIEGPFAKGDNSVSAIYRGFYRKLVYRDRSLPRPWVFTTNYDLFSERALDELGISFCNGFSGIVNRVFNPATFKYALAEQLDVSSRKWTAVDNHLYLCKLHGSINWIEDAQSGIHGIREVQEPLMDKAGDVMIFPSPAKHHATLASPYTDLFREFQSRIVREQTVLVTIGYAFGDSHIDAIIHQALTVPTFRLVVFGDPGSRGISKLMELEDPRIWIVHGQRPDGSPVHYFKHVVEQFLPDLPGERIDGSIKKVVEMIRRELANGSGGGSDY